jgi:hypothetical protein
MSNEDSSAKKVWKFSYEGWAGKLLEGTFVASQDQIDWITGQIINFGDTGKGLDLVIRMEAEQFEVINDDAGFAEQFKTTVGTVGTSPFDNLDDDQFIAHELEFREVYVDGKLVKASKPKTRLPEFSDEGIHVVTYDITDDIMNDDTANSRHQEDMDKFLSLFEVVKPEGYPVHLAPRKERYSNGDLHCMKIIKRKSDGTLFGYEYSETHGDEYCDSNGEKYDLNGKNRYAYVWLPVKAFTITGYVIDSARYELKRALQEDD